MQCKNPVVFKARGLDLPLPCGQCLPCRINKRKVWTHRMMLEASTHDQNAFLTLTYSDENLPKEWSHPETGEVFVENSLYPAHHETFINSLRRAWSRKTGKNLRYFVCGEYGEKTGRPHFHYALFGFPSCLGPGPVVQGRSFTPCPCPNCSLVSKIWRKGNIFLANLEQQSAQYIAGYVTKKLTKNSTAYETYLLNGRYPEFGRQSKNPGLGCAAVEAYADKIRPFVTSDEDIPPYLVHNGKKWPLGGYLRGKIHEKILGPYYEGEKIQNYKKNLSDMFDSEKAVGLSPVFVRGGLPEVALRIINAQRSLQIEKQQERSSFKHQTERL